ncbi:unnamed protein product [Pleuronectes platessa]|uniref:Uncharacterized protein n=1 Tax=Pleuronectes platessa TaxID=8262 RepID=A0A9N7YBY8_PLEPL|nr:unnamed protein product [Pleuronectes platessa]
MLAALGALWTNTGFEWWLLLPPSSLPPPSLSISPAPSGSVRHNCVSVQGYWYAGGIGIVSTVRGGVLAHDPLPLGIWVLSVERPRRFVPPTSAVTQTLSSLLIGVRDGEWKNKHRVSTRILGVCGVVVSPSTAADAQSAPPAEEERLLISIDPVLLTLHQCSLLSCLSVRCENQTDTDWPA